MKKTPLPQACAIATIFGIGVAGSNKVGSYPVSNLSLGINALLTSGAFNIAF